MACLNPNDKDVKQFYQKYGVAETYRIYVEEGYHLPSFAAYEKVKKIRDLSLNQAKALLGQYIDLNLFNFSDIADIQKDLPVSAVAAFAKDTFYFGSRIKQEEVHEEAFHAIFQRLLKPEDQEALLRVGLALLKAELARSNGGSVKSYYEKMRTAYPQTYTKLSEEDGYNRLFEEQLAKEFVRYMKYGKKNDSRYRKDLTATLKPIFGTKAANFVQKLIDTLYNLLMRLTRNYEKNQAFADMFFERIKRGDFFYSKIVDPGDYTTVPTTRLITLDDSNVLTVTETQEVIRNVGGLALQLKYDENTEHLDTDERIDLAMDAFRKYYENNSNPRLQRLGEVFVPEIIDEWTDEVTPVEEYHRIVKDIKSYLENLQDYEDFQDELEEDENGSAQIADFGKEANEKGGFDGMSTWLKNYIATTGKVVKDASGNDVTHTILVDGKPFTIPVLEIVDPNKVYYGLARGLGNTGDFVTRLRKLITYGDLDGNEATQAFVMKMLRDIAFKDAQGKRITDSKVLYEQAKLLFAKSDQEILSVLDAKLKTPQKILLTRVINGFDLWSRTNMRMLFDNKNGLSQLLNPNDNNAVDNQIDNWFRNFTGKKFDKQQIEQQLDNAGHTSGFIEELRGIPYELPEAYARTLSKDEVEKYINDYVNFIYRVTNSNGFSLSKEYIKYSTFRKIQERYVEDEVSYIQDILAEIDSNNILKLFDLEKDNLLFSNNSLKTIFDFLEEGKNPADKQNKDDSAVTRLKKIAEGNAVFDESVFESSYKNAENKTIYAHQSKTFHLQFFNMFKTEWDKSELKQIHEGKRTVFRLDEEGNPEYLTEDREFYTNNRFLNWMASDSLYKKYYNRFRTFSVDGSQQVDMEQTDNRPAPKKDGDQQDGVTFGGMDARTFALYRLNSLFQLENALYDTEYADNGKSTKKTEAWLQPVYMGNLEASRTADFIAVPFIRDLYDTNEGLTKKAISFITEEIRKEYDRIRKVSDQLQNNALAHRFEKYNTGKSVTRTVQETRTDENGNEYLADVQYTIPKEANSLRGLSFSDSVRSLAGSIMDIPKDTDTPENNLILHAILTQKPLSEFKGLENAIRKAVNQTLEDHYQQLVDQGVIYVNPKNGKTANLLDPRFSGNTVKTPANNKLDFGTLLGFDKDLKANLNRYFLSSFLNTLYLNQAAHGDPALLYKNDGGDMFKRFKARNAAIKSFTNPFSLPEFGINTPTRYFRYVVFDDIEVDADVPDKGGVNPFDAQNWISNKGYMRSLLGMGKLDRYVAHIMQKEDAGVKITDEEAQWLRDTKNQLGSLKTVGGTGQIYLKKSDSRLTKQLTSLSEEITEQEYLNQKGSFHPEYGYYILKPGAPPMSAYTDPDTGETTYYKWRSRPGMEQLHNMRLFMEGFRFDKSLNEWRYVGEQAEVELFMPISASKMLNPNVFKGRHLVTDDRGNEVEDKNSDFDFTRVNDDNINAIDLNFYGLQTENPSGKTKVVDPTQKLEIILNELDNAEIWVNGNKIDQYDFLNRYQQYLTDRDQINYDIARQSLYDENDNIKLDVLYEKIFMNFLESKADQQTIDFANPDQEGGPFNLNIPLMRDAFIKQYFAHFTKEILSHKRAGDAFTHVTSYGHSLVKQLDYVRDASGTILKDGNGNAYVTWRVVRRDTPEYLNAANDQSLSSRNMANLHYHGTVQNDALYEDSEWHQQARKLLEASGGNPVYILDNVRHLKPRWQNGNVTGYFTEAMVPRWDNNITDLTDDLKYMFGVRIPSQDKHSFINLEWIDTLPDSFGSSIVTAKEVVFLSGSDFDVDKLFVVKPEVYWNGEQWVKYGSGITDAEKFEQWLTYLSKYNKTYNAAVRKQSKQFFKSTIPERAEYEQKSNRLDELSKEIRSIKRLRKQYFSENQEVVQELKSQRNALKEITKEKSLELQDIDTAINELVGQLAEKDTTAEIAVLTGKKDKVKKRIEQKQIALDVIRERIDSLFENLPGGDLAEKLKERDRLTAELAEIKVQQITVPVLQSLRLPSSVEEYAATGKDLNVGSIHNQMLEIEQGALNNNKTLDKAYGQISHTPADLKVLQDLKKETYDGVPLFGATNKRMSLHWFYSHTNVHEKNTVGKSLIGVGVNANLFTINAIRYNFKINDQYLPNFTKQWKQADGTVKTTISSGEYRTFGEDGSRNFNVFSTIITADTDEAKEQLNAFFQMDEQGQAVVFHLVGIGYSIKEAMLFINQPVIQKYVKKIKGKSAAIKNLQEEEYYRTYNTEEAIAMDVLGLKSTEEWDAVKFSNVTYNEETLQKIIVSSKDKTKKYQIANRKEIEERLLSDFIQILEVNKFAGNFVRFIKLKKGFGSELKQYDLLLEAINNLGFTNDKYSPLTVPIDIRNRIEKNADGSAKQIYNYLKTEGIINDNYNIQNRLFIERSHIFKSLLENFDKHLALNSRDAKDLITKAAESYLFSALYKSVLMETHPEWLERLNVNELYPEKLVARFKQTVQKHQSDPNSPLYGNPLFSKLVPYQREGLELLRLNTTKKLLPEEQTALIDGFHQLMMNQETTDLAVDLFHYFILKDGWMFKMGNISKIFTTKLFRSLSNALTNYMENPDLIVSSVFYSKAIYDLATDVNYTTLIKRIKIADDNKYVTKHTYDGNRKGEQMIVFNVGNLSEDKAREASFQSGINVGHSEEHGSFGVFPKFIKQLVNVSDDPDRTRYEEFYYELLKLYDVNEEPVQYDQIKLQLNHQGKRAVYVRMIPTGSKLVSPMTISGKVVTKSQNEQLDNLITNAEIPQSIRNYYESKKVAEDFVNQGINLYLAREIIISDSPSEQNVTTSSNDDLPQMVLLSSTDRITTDLESVAISEKYIAKEDQLNEQQAEAVQKAMQIINRPEAENILDDSFLLSGKGGTGKTYTSEILISKILEKDRYASIVIAAPTWNAVNELASAGIDEPVTFASLVGTKLGDPDENGVQEFELFDDQKIQTMINYGTPPLVFVADYLVIDESSMIGGNGRAPHQKGTVYNSALKRNVPRFVSTDAWETLKYRLKQREQWGYGRPKKIIFMGDYAQISPVGTAEDKDSPIIEYLLDRPDQHHVLLKNMRTKKDDLHELHEKYRTNIDAANTGLKKGKGSNDTIIRNPNDITKRKDSENIKYISSDQELVDLFAYYYTRNPGDIKSSVIVNYNNYNKPVTQQLIAKIRRTLFGLGDVNEFHAGELLILKGNLKTVVLSDGRSSDMEFHNETRFYVENVTPLQKLIQHTHVINRQRINYEFLVEGFDLKLTTDVAGEKVSFTQFVPKKGQLEKIFGSYESSIRGFITRDGQTVPYGAFLGIKEKLPEMQYGYVVNSHKVQGSSYVTTLVDESNIMAAPVTNKEFNQLIYTAVSRPKQKLVIYNRSNPAQATSQFVKEINNNVTIPPQQSDDLQIGNQDCTNPS